MKKNINHFWLFLCFLFCVLIFKENGVFKITIINAADIFFESVFPSLFIMIIMVDLLNNYHFINVLIFLFGKFFRKLFKMSDSAIYIFLMSFFTGTPTNGYMVNDFFKKGFIDKKEAEVILSFSFFLNPLFLLNMFDYIFMDRIITIKLLIIYYLGNIIMVFLNRNKNYNKKRIRVDSKINAFSIVLNNSLKKAFNILLNVLGTIIFYLCLAKGINIIFNNPFLDTLISGLLEVSGGFYKLKLLNVSLEFKEILSLLFASLSGFSILSQVYSTLEDVDISFKRLVIERVKHFIICILLFILT